MLGDFDAVKIARARQRYVKNFADPSRCRRHDYDAIGQARRFPHVVCNEDNRFAALLPNALDVAVKLLARHGVERRERFVHQEHTRVRRQRARQRHALFHAAGKLMHVCFHEFFQADQMKKEFCDLTPFRIAQARL